MASTLVSMSSVPPQRHPQLFHTSSPSLQMPNVFVIPPAEEDSPAWCCFDAAQSTEHDQPGLPDLDVLEAALNALQYSDSFPPVFCRDSEHAHKSGGAVVMPRRDERPSISDVLMKDDEEHPNPPRRVQREPGNDSEIVEVIKVKRPDRQDPTISAAPSTKRSKTFRSRASRAFRSIKSIARSTKPNTKDIFTASVSTEATVTSEQTQPKVLDESTTPQARTRTPTLSHRRSFILSQIFHAPSLKTRASFDNSSPAFPSSSTQSSPYIHLGHADTSLSLDQLAPNTDHDRDHDSLRAASPSPSTQTFSRSRRRLSMLNLQRLFSFSANSDSSTTPTSVSHDSSGPSTSSTSSVPGTPMDDLYLTEIMASGNLGGARDAEWPSPKIDTLPDVAHGDISVEMRLNSLHFESISFDVDKF
jgi:hypothetical protein